MKKIMLFVSVAALLVGAFLLGRFDGIRHAVEDSELWIVEFDDPDIPGNYDLRIWIDLDGQSFEHFGYIG